ncbi:MAG: NnrU family protein [Pseudazoarcus pumilus]|nr:NnrU family protein [Pseudazoarcus pumilus]
MLLLIAGLWLFFSFHSVRMLAPETRDRAIERIGEPNWKLVYAGASLTGLILIVLGFSDAHMNPLHVWTPPVWTRHLAAALMLPAFILLAATYVRGSLLRERLGHPMLAGTKLWALAHLLANGTLADMVLFGSFLVWAALSFSAARKRDRAHGVTRPPGRWSRDLIAVVIGAATWFAFAAYLHGVLFGVRPFG